MAKLLLATIFALVAVARTTDVYTASYDTVTNDCTGTLDSYKQTLDLCTLTQDGGYNKVTLSGTTYSYAAYTDSTCTTSDSNIVSNPFSGAADACIAYTQSGSDRSATVLSTSAYASGATTTYDCTSGTCVENVDVYIASYNTVTNDCTGTLDSYKQTLGLCTLTQDGGYSKLTLSGTTYSYAAYTDSTCTTSDSNIVSNPFSGAADACIAYTQSGSDRSATVLSTSAYASGATSTYDCTSGTCAAASSNSAGTRSPVPLPCELSHAFVSAHASVGILSICLAVMARWVMLA